MHSNSDIKLVIFLSKVINDKVAKAKNEERRAFYGIYRLLVRSCQAPHRVQVVRGGVARPADSGAAVALGIDGAVRRSRPPLAGIAASNVEADAYRAVAGPQQPAADRRAAHLAR